MARPAAPRCVRCGRRRGGVVPRRPSGEQPSAPPASTLAQRSDTTGPARLSAEEGIRHGDDEARRRSGVRAAVPWAQPAATQAPRRADGRGRLHGRRDDRPRRHEGRRVLRRVEGSGRDHDGRPIPGQGRGRRPLRRDRRARRRRALRDRDERDADAARGDDAHVADEGAPRRPRAGIRADDRDGADDPSDDQGRVRVAPGSLGRVNVEYYEPDDEQKLTVATAYWDGREITITSQDAAAREALTHAFRRSPVVVDDPSLRRLGTHGPSTLQPGDLEWFRAVARYRATDESGLVARFVPGTIVGGFDPAANYRRFEEQIERLDAPGRRSTSSASQALPASQNPLKSQNVHQRPGVGSYVPASI